MKSKKQKSIRYAVVGLGYIAQAAVLPAFRHAAKNSTLAALVSDDPKKLQTLGAKYGISELYSYDDYLRCLRSGAVDAVYLALPNSLHAKFAVRAAREGIHVLCEKPLAVDVPECERMIRACEKNGVRLMTAYRLHFEAANLKAVELARSGKLGELKGFQSSFSMQVKPGNIRLRRDLGGGPLFDLGIYCVNAARYLFREEPTEVFGMASGGHDSRFREVEESFCATLRFPKDRVAQFFCSFGSANTSRYELVGTKGSLSLDPAYELAEGLTYELKIGEKKRSKTLTKRDQFGPELIYFSDCIMKNRQPEPSGAEGLADVRIIQALHQSARSGKTIHLSPFEKKQRPRNAQEIHCSPTGKIPLIHAESPSA